MVGVCPRTDPRRGVLYCGGCGGGVLRLQILGYISHGNIHEINT